MKKILLFTLIIATSCNAQKGNIIDLSSTNEDMNYIFSRIYNKPPLNKTLFDGGLFVYIFKFSDSKITPDDFSPGTEEFLDSYMVSVAPDGDYYSGSKLYKIEGLVNPKILGVKELKYPVFSLKIEHGIYNKREMKNFEFKGIE